ncbi:hypothetical protein VPH35_140142 [Triticum aestivum]|uniref:Uncharacterized protein n=1 Tax=Aegilops tauschii TaxID=37682 RepID=R7W3R8_AEGTA
MAFQAAMQPPAWMPTDLFRFNVGNRKTKFGGHVVTIRKDGPGGRAAVMARFYMLANMVTFGMGLGVLVSVLKPADLRMIYLEIVCCVLNPKVGDCDFVSMD